jgi:hypothetical protein
VSSRSRHLGALIARPAAEVYAYARDPAHLPACAAGLSSGIALVDGEWVTDSPMGPVTVRFATTNEFGVLDHRVTLPGGEAVENPMRVLADGPGAYEVVFTVRHRPGMTAEEFEHDCAAVAADLQTLRGVLEGQRG